MFGLGALAAACSCFSWDNKRSLSLSSVCLLKRGGWLGRGLVIEAGPENQRQITLEVRDCNEISKLALMKPWFYRVKVAVFGVLQEILLLFICHMPVVSLNWWLDLGILEPGAGVNIGLGVTRSGTCLTGTDTCFTGTDTCLTGTGTWYSSSHTCWTMLSHSWS